jgi:hypothetical protein
LIRVVSPYLVGGFAIFLSDFVGGGPAHGYQEFDFSGRRHLKQSGDGLFPEPSKHTGTQALFGRCQAKMLGCDANIEESKPLFHD